MRILFHFVFVCSTLSVMGADRDTLALNSLLYNGTEYKKVFDASKGNPFFPTNNNRGQVKYQGNWYADLDILYDCQDDVVITRDPDGNLKLQLVKEKLEAFIVDGHQFVRLSLLNARGEFYEQLHSGPRSVYLEWRKRTDSDEILTQRFILSKEIFVLYEGKVFPIGSESDLFALSSTHEREVRKYYRESRLSYKKDPILASIHLVKAMEENAW